MVRSRGRNALPALLIGCVAAVGVFSLSGCPKKEAPSTGPGPAPGTATGTAPAKAPPVAAGEVTLTAKLVEQWTDSMADATVVAVLAELKPQGQVPIAQLAETAEKAGDRPELSEAVKAHGFADGAEWAVVTKRVYAGLLPMMIEQSREPTRQALKDPAKVEEAMKAIDGKVEEAKAAFGELTDEEMKIVEDALEDISKATS